MVAAFLVGATGGLYGTRSIRAPNEFGYDGIETPIALTATSLA